MRYLLVVAVLVGCATPTGARAQSTATSAQKSIHLAPIGAPVTKSFDLVGKTFPLPEGQFLLAATRIAEPARGAGSGDFLHVQPKYVEVLLAQTDGRKVRTIVWAATLLEAGGGEFGGRYSTTPCNLPQALFLSDLAGSGGVIRNCLRVIHGVNAMGASAKDIYAEAARWLGQRGIELPIHVVIDVSYGYTQAGDKMVAARYAFNPESFGCHVPRTISGASQWRRDAVAKDPDRTRFVDSVVEWGKLVQSQITEAMEGRRVPAQIFGQVTTSQKIYQCGQPSAEPSSTNLTPKSTERGVGGSVAERLRVLEGLLEQKLISPKEYEDRRKAILNSL